MNIKFNQVKSVTLFEVIIALVAFSAIVLYFTAIENISRSDLMTADRRTKVQNEAAYLMEHITKNITGTSSRGGAIGNTSIDAQVPVTQTPSPNTLIVWVDYNNDGQKTASDRRIAYSYDATNYQILYTDNYGTTTPTAITSKRICGNFGSTTSDPTYVSCIRSSDTSAIACSSCGSSSPCNNYLNIQVTSCWDPDGSPDACGTSKNPQVAVHAYIRMPAVATH